MTAVRRVLVSFLTLCLGLFGLVLADSGSALAATDPNSFGSIKLLAADGATAVTTGASNAKKFVPYVEGSNTRTSTDTKATLFLASVQTSDPSLWPTTQIGGSSTYPVASPAALASTSNPVFSSAANDDSLETAAAKLQAPSTANAYQLRLETSGPNHPASSPYDSVDVTIDATAHTFTLANQVAFSNVTLAVPGSPAAAGTTETLTATVDPTAQGTVEFFDGATSLGSSNVTAGSATKSTVLGGGAHSLRAVYTPDGTVTTTAVTSSNTVAYTVTPTATTTTLSVTPTGGTSVTGTVETLTAMVTGAPTTEGGQVQFFDGTTKIGTPVSYSASASGFTTTTTLTTGSHSLTATYLPKTSDYAGSTSAAVTYSVTQKPTSVTAPTFSPTSPAPGGTTETFSAVVTESGATTIAGTVAFTSATNGGGTSYGSTTTIAADGTATTTAKLPSGSYTVFATFTPSDASYATSSSASSAYTVSPPTPTTITLATSPASSAQAGTLVTVTATITPATAAGTVQFADGSASLGSVPVSGGKASVSGSALAVGAHSFTATFTPTDAAVVAGSTTASATPFTVTPAPVVIPAPVNTAAPSLSGLGKVGTTETCLTGTFSNAATYTYAFSANGVVVQAASATATLALTPATYKKALTCTVTATGPSGSATATSAAITVAVGAKLKHVKGTSITGKAKKNAKLTASVGTWSPKATSYTYQWKSNGKAIKKATKSTYKVTAADLKKKITVTVTAKSTGYTSATFTTKSVTAKS